LGGKKNDQRGGGGGGAVVDQKQKPCVTRAEARKLSMEEEGKSQIPGAAETIKKDVFRQKKKKNQKPKRLSATDKFKQITKTLGIEEKHLPKAKGEGRDKRPDGQRREKRDREIRATENWKEPRKTEVYPERKRNKTPMETTQAH